MNQLRISAAARDDMNSAFKWYNNQQAGVGNEFIQKVFITFHAIEQNPFLYAEKFSGKFRFAIVNG